MKEQRRRTTADGRRMTADGSAHPCAVVVRRWSVVGCANAVILATSGRPESDGAERFTTKAPRHQGKTHREDGEVREERFHHKGTKDTKAKRCKPQAARTRRKEGYGLWIIRPCFRPSVVCVLRGHGGKISPQRSQRTQRKKKQINHR
jgi:hypothetical protein